MKKLSFLLVISLGILSFKTNGNFEEKKYAVTFTQAEWEVRYRWIEVAKEQLKASDLPSKTVVYINDSLLGKFQTDLANQLRPQFLAAQKQDSINHKK